MITWKREKLKAGISAFNDSGEELGWLAYQRVGRFMQWVWFQNADIWMSAGCLDEVRKKQKELWGQKDVVKIIDDN